MKDMLPPSATESYRASVLDLLARYLVAQERPRPTSSTAETAMLMTMHT